MKGDTKPEFYHYQTRLASLWEKFFVLQVYRATAAKENSLRPPGTDLMV